jgi:hypothetical protein
MSTISHWSDDLSPAIRPKTVLENFESNVASVKNLMSFDSYVLEMAISSIEELHQRLKHGQGMENPQLNGERTLTMLRQFHSNASLKPKYQTIFNQGLVLLVSYFASAVHDLFKGALEISILNDTDSPALAEDLKITMRDLKEVDFDLQASFAGLFVRAKDISFQDMQSIGRAFKTYLQIEIVKDEVVNEIILGQACRHVIVHAGGLINKMLLRQVSGAKPRNLKPKLIEGELIHFTPEEVELVANKMCIYLQRLSTSVERTTGVRV